jgi:DNA-binding GntR family transcriptional regulator
MVPKLDTIFNYGATIFFTKINICAYDGQLCRVILDTLKPSQPADCRETKMKRSAKQAAYAYLKEKILSGDLAVSAPIRPEHVAQALGISRMPVREALLQLNLEGLVTFGDNRRAFVTARSPNEIIELFEIRVALECLAISRAVPNLTPQDFIELEEQLERMNRMVADVRQWLELHWRFHEIIYAAARMPRLLDEIRRLQEHISPFLLMYSSMIDIMRKGDPTAAATALADHIRCVASGIIYFILSGRKQGGETLSYIHESPLKMEKM